MPLRPKNLLKISDLMPHQFESVIGRAIALKKTKRSKFDSALRNRTLLMFMDKPSLRTRISFEVGMTQLGGHGLYYPLDSYSNMGKKESVYDTAMTASVFGDIIMTRLSEHTEEFAQHCGVPVINGLSPTAHPCQITADALTMQEHLRKSLNETKVAFFGDVCNNVTYDLLRLGAMMRDMHVIAIGPNAADVPAEIIAECEELSARYGGNFDLTTNIEAAKGCDVVYTDSFMSYDVDESLKEERMKLFTPYTVTSNIMKNAHPEAIFMHCLPAQRNAEVTPEVIDGPQSRVFQQAENRMHAQKAIMMYLMKQEIHEGPIARKPKFFPFGEFI